MFNCILQQILGVGTSAEKSLVRRVHVHAAACKDVLGFSVSANSHAAVHDETHQDETARFVNWLVAHSLVVTIAQPVNAYAWCI